VAKGTAKIASLSKYDCRGFRRIINERKLLKPTYKHLDLITPLGESPDVRVRIALIVAITTTKGNKESGR
jgi:hypothetical protein